MKKILNWFKPDPDNPIVFTDRTVLAYGINDYPGSGNDLNGCLNDIKRFIKKMNTDFPGFQINKFENSRVTRNVFLSNLQKAIDALPPDATVALFMDCCHSASNTRANLLGGFVNKVRYFDPGIRYRTKKKLRFKSHVGLVAGMKWLAFAACRDDQYASDAWFNGIPYGAYSYYDIPCMEPGITYQELYNRIRTQLPSSTFSQEPILEGPEYLRQRKLFEGPTLIVRYSGHGSQVPDKDGDEPDYLDETLYLADGKHVVDDETNKILLQIKT